MKGIIRVCFAIPGIVAGLRKGRARARANHSESLSASDKCIASWDNVACRTLDGCDSCGNRIVTRLVSQGIFETAAKEQVALEFPTECGGCASGPSPQLIPLSFGCCKWGDSCGDCGCDGSGWCHQSESNCNACTGSWDSAAAVPQCPPPTPAPTPAPPTPAPGPFPDDAFSIVLIPDVQFMSRGNEWDQAPPRYAFRERWYAQGEWVAANKDILNIKAVVQLGDLVEEGCDDSNWVVFNRGWDPIHATGLPYSWAAGNHDCDHLYGCNPPGWSCFNRQVPNFLDNVSFPVEFWPGQGQYQNMMTLFEAEGIKFIVIAVEWNTPPEALAWARQKVEQHSDRWAIFNVHYEPAAPGYLDLAKSHNKTFMLAQGHHCICGEEEHRFHQGAGTQPFIELLVDYQCNDNGFLKHFTIDMAAGKVRAHTYNPATDTSRTGSDYDWSWDFQF